MSTGGVDHVAGLVYGTTVSCSRTASAILIWAVGSRSNGRPSSLLEATAPPERHGGRSPEFGLPVAPELWTSPLGVREGKRGSRNSPRVFSKAGKSRRRLATVVGSLDEKSAPARWFGLVFGLDWMGRGWHLYRGERDRFKPSLEIDFEV